MLVAGERGRHHLDVEQVATPSGHAVDVELASGSQLAEHVDGPGHQILARIQAVVERVGNRQRHGHELLRARLAPAAMGEGLLGNKQLPVRGHRRHVVVDELDRLALPKKLDSHEIPEREARQGRRLDDVTVGLPGSSRADIGRVDEVAIPPRWRFDAESGGAERIGMPQPQEMRKLVRCQPSRRRHERRRGRDRPPRNVE